MPAEEARQNYSQKKIREKNLPRHSAKKINSSLEDRPVN
jgi:hypothetical protein